MAGTNSRRPSGSGQGFPTTRWSLVDLASYGGDSEALEHICKEYWYPLYAFARRSGHSPTDAEDLTQGFFERLLEKDWLANVDRAKGRLRTFLLTAFRRYWAKEWRRNQADKRGGGWTRMDLEQIGSEDRYATAKPNLEPEDLFDRQWAIGLIERSLDKLQREFVDRGKGDHFEVLKSVLMLDKEAIDYATLSSRLEMTKGATRVAVHRLRKNFRARFRDEVALTLEEGEDLESELQYLAQVLAS